MDYLDLLIANKEWVFSGVGVVLSSSVIAFLVWVFKKNTPDSKGEQYGSISNLFPPSIEPKRKEILSLYYLIPNFVLRRIFPESRIIPLISIDIRARGESARLNLGELPSCNVYVVIVNHAPFNVEFESIKAKLNYGGCLIKLESTEYVKVKKHSTNNLILLEGVLTGEQATHCSKQKDDIRTSMAITARFKCSFGVFDKHTGDLDYINSSIINKRTNRI